jgi:hypothetical protein
MFAMNAIHNNSVKHGKLNLNMTHIIRWEQQLCLVHLF